MRHYGGENLRTLSMAVASLDRALASRMGGDNLLRAELPGVLLMLAMKFLDSSAGWRWRTSRSQRCWCSSS